MLHSDVIWPSMSSHIGAGCGRASSGCWDTGVGRLSAPSLLSGPSQLTSSYLLSSEIMRLLSWLPKDREERSGKEAPGEPDNLPGAWPDGDMPLRDERRVCVEAATLAWKENTADVVLSPLWLMFKPCSRKAR